MSRLIDADAIYPWYMDNFHFDPNEVRFSMNDIRDNLDNIPTHPTPSNTLGALDCVSREDLTKGIEAYFDDLPIAVHYDMLALAQKLPSAQSERDIPVKPIETTDKAWGIPNKQAVCPKCDYYLSHISFLGDYKGKRITYCETCGQAIDWEGWDWDEED